MEAPDLWQRVEELFHSALEREPGQRAAFLSRACASEPEVLVQVEALLRAQEEIGSFLQPLSLNIDTGASTDAGSGFMIGQSLSRFKVISLLGKGGMGEVYLADDTKLGRKVAIKSLPARLMGDDQAKMRLMREARAAARLDHPNICPIYEVGEEDNQSFIVMPYIEGETLFNKIRGEEMRLGEYLDIAMQVAAALSNAHSNGIIHRDIKPQNIIINTDGQVKVLDFGLVKALPRERETESGRDSQALLTLAGAIVGTAAYMSPEQVKNAPLSASSDLFSLGALLYECVTGRPAFSGNSIMEICAQVIHIDPPSPSSLNPLVPPELDRIILKALAKDAGARYQSALEILEDLRPVRDSLQAEKPASRKPSQLLPVAARMRAAMNPRSIARSRHFKTGLFILPVVALALWAGFHLRLGSSHRPSPDALRLYEMGRSSLSDGSYYQASKVLERALSIDDKFPLAHARLAEAWLEMDYPDRAKDELLLATELVPDRAALDQADALYLDAISATVRRDFARAVDHFREVAELAAEPQKALGYVDLGRAYQRNEEIEKAMESYQESIRRDPESAAAYLRAAILYGRSQDMRKANELIDKAEAIYQSLSNLEGVTEALFQRGYLLNSVDRIADARAQLEKALGIAQIIDNKHQRIRILLQLSSLSCTEGDAERARQYASEAIDLAQGNNTESLASNGIIDLGNSFFLRGEFGEAEKYFRQAIEFAQRSRSRRSEARGLLSLGSLLIQRGDVDGGLGHVEQALAFYQQGGYRKETSQALILLGRGNRQRGQYDLALRAFERQLHLAEEIGDQSQLATSHSGIGTLLGYYQERYPEALSHLEESYKINNSLGAKLNSGYDLMNRGGLLWQLGRYTEARAAFSRAASIANNPDTRSKHLLALIYLMKSRMELSEALLAQAGADSRQASELAGGTYRDIAIQAEYTYSLAQARSGKAHAGRPACEGAVKRAEESRNPRLLSSGLLALAEVLLLARNWQEASTIALQAQARFAEQGLKDSEWRAWLLAAHAAQSANDKATASTYAARAAGALSDLRERLGEEHYRTYLARPDIISCRTMLDQILATNR